MMPSMFDVGSACRARVFGKSLPSGALAGVLLVAIGLRLAVAMTWPSLPWPDEIFQTMEQAHRLVFGYGVVPWEFRVGARSWLFPALIAAVMQIGNLFGGQGYLRSVQIAMACLSLVPVAVAFSWAYRRHGVLAAAAASLAASTWFELIYFSTRTLTEVAAAHTIIAALYLASSQELRQRRLLVCGITFGVAAALRFHLTPAIVACVALLCGRSLSRWRAVLIGMAIPVIGAGVLDLVTWSGFLSSFVSNFRHNIIEGKSASYGVEPWYWYIEQLADTGSWAALTILGLAAIGANRQRVTALFAAVALFTHSLLAHKEYRFIYPVVAAGALLASQGLVEVGTWVSRRYRVNQAAAIGAGVLLWSALSGWRASRFATANAEDRESMWRVNRDTMMATAAMGADHNVCGVGVVDINWAATGGYTYLHRNLPMYLIVEPSMLFPAIPAFNAAVVPRVLAAEIPGYEATQCWESVCIVKRQGACQDVAEKINDALARVKE